MSSPGTVNRFLCRWSVAELKDGLFVSIAVALILIVASVFVFASLAERTQQILIQQKHEALLGDAVFESANPPPASLTQFIAQHGLTSSVMTRFATMAFSDHRMTLVMVKAVEASFPLKGQLQLSSNNRQANTVKPGEIWLDKSLFTQLSVQEGTTITIGDLEGRISGDIAQEPGLSFNPFRQLPTVLISQADVAKTGALQRGSRVSYTVYINGPSAVLQQLKHQVPLSPSDQWVDIHRSDRIGDVFHLTRQYLSIVVIMVLLMASLTLVLTCRHYVTSREKTIGMLKSLGASRAWIRHWLLIQMGMMLFVSVIPGLLVGIGLEWLIRLALSDLLPQPVPAVGATPFIVAMLTCVMIALPALWIPLSRFLSIPASVVMSSLPLSSGRRAWYLVLLPVIALFVYFGHGWLIWCVMAGMVGVFIGLALVSISIVRLSRYFVHFATFKLAMNRLSHSVVGSGLQFGALALSLMLMGTLWLVRTDLLSDWHDVLPSNAPNVFAFNIAPSDTSAYLDRLRQFGFAHSPVFPIVRGRLTRINGQDANTSIPNAKQVNALQRELNFTWSRTLPAYNQVLAGNWTDSHGVSVEQKLAADLNIHVGDRLTFTINSAEVSAVVNAIRQVEWRDMKPNFFFIFTPDVLQGMPETGLLSFRVSADKNAQLNQLAMAFPTVSVIDLRKITQKIQVLLRHIIWVVSLMATLAIGAGLLLIFTLLRLSLSERAAEIRLYRTLGASRRCIVATLWIEFGTMAVVGGWVAGMAADGVTALFMSYGLSLTPRFHFLLWIGLPIISLILLFMVVRSVFAVLLRPRY